MDKEPPKAMDGPLVSILMGVYNCAGTLAEAIGSIQSQTYPNWELIVCDDGSRDNTKAVALGYAAKDTRIRVIANERNLGLAPTLDLCRKEARGPYLARMDGDDISEPERLSKLVAALESHPGIDIVSSWMLQFDENGPWGVIQSKPHPSPDDFWHGSPICHAPCMMRREAFDKVGGYGSERWAMRVEDYYLWFRMYAAGMRAMNLQEPLYRMRDDRLAAGRRNLRARLNETIVRWKGFGLLGYPLGKRLWAIKPLLVWLLPRALYQWVRRRRQRLSRN